MKEIMRNVKEMTTNIIIFNEELSPGVRNFHGYKTDPRIN